MRMISIRAVILIGAFLLALSLSGSGCGKKPTEPSPSVEKDYVIYFGDDVLTNKYFGYHTKTGVIDSFALSYPVYKSGLVSSPDGNILYLNPPGKIVEVSTTSHAIIAEHPISINRDYSIVNLAVSSNGRLLASCKRDLAIIDLTSYNVVYYDTTNHSAPYFGKSSGNLFCVTEKGNGPRGFRIIDCAHSYADTVKTFPYGSAFKILPDADNEERWYTLLYVSRGVYLLQVYDFTLDSVLFSKTLIPGMGDLVQTPDGNLLFFSQPDSKWMPTGPIVCHFGRLDCHALDNIENINTLTIDTDTLKMVCPVGELCITPNGHRLIGTNPLLGQILDFDIQSNAYIRQIEFSKSIQPINVTCQTKP